MIMKLRNTILVLGAMGLIGVTSARADLTYNFATGASGSDGGGFNGGTFTWSSTLQAVQFTGTAGGWTMGGAGPKFEFGWPSQSTMQTMAAAGNARLSFDLSLNASSYTVGSWANGSWYQLHVAGNSDGSQGWTQDPPSGANLVSGSYNPSSPNGNWHFDFSFAQMGWQSGDTWFQIFFGANSDAANPLQFYIDNITAYQPVPEPATFSLLGLGAVALWIRRRS